MGTDVKYERTDLLERTLEYSRRVIRLYRTLEKDSVARILGKQLLSSGTSIGANLHEAQAGQSRADFISKVSVAHKESIEALYWLRLLQGENITSDAWLLSLIDETEQLAKILSCILLSSKKLRH